MCAIWFVTEVKVTLEGGTANRDGIQAVDAESCGAMGSGIGLRSVVGLQMMLEE